MGLSPAWHRAWRTSTGFKGLTLFPSSVLRQGTDSQGFPIWQAEPHKTWKDANYIFQVVDTQIFFDFLVILQISQSGLFFTGWYLNFWNITTFFCDLCQFSYRRNRCLNSYPGFWAWTASSTGLTITSTLSWHLLLICSIFYKFVFSAAKIWQNVSNVNITQ